MTDQQKLRMQAYATPFPEYDIIISHIFELEEQEKNLLDGIAELKIANARQEERLREMESLRSKFKRNRYDSAGTGFSDPAVIYTMLGNLINGAMTKDAFGRILEQQRCYEQRRADPRFGSGGFGRGTVWGSGMRFPISGGRGGFRFPGGGGSRSGEGFTTRGGF